jgi:hypothetical protein
MPRKFGLERTYRGDLWLLDTDVSARSVNHITLVLLTMCTSDEEKALGMMILMTDRG